MIVSKSKLVLIQDTPFIKKKAISLSNIIFSKSLENSGSTDTGL